MQRMAWVVLAVLLPPWALCSCTPRRGGSGGGDDFADDDAEADDDDVSQEPFGPDNGWWHALTADVPTDLAGTGWATGDTANDFSMPDQFGDTVQLYQFLGKVVVLDLFAFW